MAAFAGLGTLVAMVAVFAILLQTGDGASGFDVLVGVLGLVGAGAAASVGYLGGSGIGKLKSASMGAEPVDAMAVRARLIPAAAVAEGIGVLVTMGAMTVVLGVFD